METEFPESRISTGNKIGREPEKLPMAKMGNVGTGMAPRMIPFGRKMH